MADYTNIYNYYSTTITTSMTKYDNHKKDELKNVYSNMVKVNRKTPFFKLSMSQKTQEYAIDIKEAAHNLKNLSSFLGDDSSSAFTKQMSISSDPDSLSVNLVNSDYSKVPSKLNIRVDKLAGAQINTGEYVNSIQSGLSEGTYSFDINSDNTNYSLKLDVYDDENNVSVQKKLVDFINNKDMGIKASLDVDGIKSSIKLESASTGINSETSDLKFTLRDMEGGRGVVSYFGLNNTTQFPNNSVFYINDSQNTSATNNISINNTLEIDFNKETQDNIEIKLVPDTNQVIDKLDEFIGAYNRLVDVGEDNIQDQRGAKKLLNDIGSVVNKHKNALESAGFVIGKDNHLSKDESLFIQSAKSGQSQELFSGISGFKDDIINTTNKLSLNPMEYVDKVVVTYPNVKNNFPNPYMPSIYSGMLFNYYV